MKFRVRWLDDPHLACVVDRFHEGTITRVWIGRLFLKVTIRRSVIERSRARLTRWRAKGPAARQLGESR